MGYNLDLAVKDAASGRTPTDVRIARLFRLTQAQRAVGRKTVIVKVADLEALVVAAAVKAAVTQ